MPLTIRITFYFTGFLWLLTLLGVYSLVWGGNPDAANLVVGVGPSAVVMGLVAYSQWWCWRDQE